MRTVTKEYKVYKYEELSDEAKENAKINYLETLDSDSFTEIIYEDLQSLYGKGIENLKTYYSLSNCQGDGLCFYGKIYLNDIGKKLEEIFYKNFDEKDFQNLKEIKEYNDVILFEHTSNHYFHKYTVDIDIEIDDESDNEHEKTVEKLLSNVKEWYYGTCDFYEKWGYEYFYEVDEETLKDYYQDWEFLENGKIFH